MLYYTIILYWDAHAPVARPWRSAAARCSTEPRRARLCTMLFLLLLLLIIIIIIISSSTTITITISGTITITAPNITTCKEATGDNVLHTCYQTTNGLLVWVSFICAHSSGRTVNLPRESEERESGVRPISLLRLSLLRFADLQFPGNSPWAWDKLVILRLQSGGRGERTYHAHIYIYIYISKFGGCKRQDSLS